MSEKIMETKINVVASEDMKQAVAQDLEEEETVEKQKKVEELLEDREELENVG